MSPLPIDLSEIGAAVRARRMQLRIPLKKLAHQAIMPVGQLIDLEAGRLDDVPLMRLQRLLVCLGAELRIRTYYFGRPTAHEVQHEDNCYWAGIAPVSTWAEPNEQPDVHQEPRFWLRM